MNQNEINLKFYENLVEIAKNVFGDLPESEIKYTEEGRGSSPDDMLYIISEYYKNKQWDIWNLKNSVYMAEAVRLAVNLYCKEHNLAKYNDKNITISIEKNDVQLRYVDPETKILYIENIPFVDPASTFDKQHINIEDLIPKFIKSEPVSFICTNPNMKLTEIRYRKYILEKPSIVAIFEECSE